MQVPAEASHPSVDECVDGFDFENQTCLPLLYIVLEDIPQVQYTIRMCFT
jgi:hypothetical protein